MKKQHNRLFDCVCAFVPLACVFLHSTYFSFLEISVTWKVTSSYLEIFCNMHEPELHTTFLAICVCVCVCVWVCGCVRVPTRYFLSPHFLAFRRLEISLASLRYKNGNLRRSCGLTILCTKNIRYYRKRRSWRCLKFF